MSDRVRWKLSPEYAESSLLLCWLNPAGSSFRSRKSYVLFFLEWRLRKESAGSARRSETLPEVIPQQLQALCWDAEVMAITAFDLFPYLILIKPAHFGHSRVLKDKLPKGHVVRRRDCATDSAAVKIPSCKAITVSIGFFRRNFIDRGCACRSSHCQPD